MAFRGWVIVLAGLFVGFHIAEAQCNDPNFATAIQISEDGHLEIKNPQTSYSYVKKTETNHRFTPRIGPRLESILGRPLLRGVVTDSQNRVQSIDFLEWGHMSMPTPEYVFTTAYSGEKCYIEKMLHKDANKTLTLFAHAGMCRELITAEGSCKSDCESQAHDEKLKEIIKRYGGSFDNLEKVRKDFKMKLTFQSVRSGLYQSAVYIDRCHQIGPIRMAVENESLWKAQAGNGAAPQSKTAPGRQ